MEAILNNFFWNHSFTNFIYYDLLPKAEDLFSKNKSKHITFLEYKVL